MNKKKNIPQKGASKKWSERLNELGNQSPPQDIVDRLNSDKKEEKKIAQPLIPSRDEEA
jgi:hypothetical protein